MVLAALQGALKRRRPAKGLLHIEVALLQIYSLLLQTSRSNFNFLLQFSNLAATDRQLGAQRENLVCAMLAPRSEYGADVHGHPAAWAEHPVTLPHGIVRAAAS
ncbi:MAG: hypothetical protein ACREUQ_06920 [Burkholderiales bacterium]